jgi:hypothetical protein
MTKKKKLHLVGPRQLTSIVSGMGVTFGLAAFSVPAFGGTAVALGVTCVSGLIAVGSFVKPPRRTVLAINTVEKINAKELVPDNEARKENLRLTAQVNKIREQTATPKYTLPFSAQTVLTELQERVLKLVTEEDLDNIDIQQRLLLEAILNSYIPDSLQMFSILTPKDKQDGSEGANKLTDQFTNMIKALDDLEEKLYKAKLEQFDTQSRFITEIFSHLNEEEEDTKRVLTAVAEEKEPEDYSLPTQEIKARKRKRLIF